MTRFGHALREARDHVERLTGRRFSRATISAWFDGWLVRVLKRRIRARIRLVEEKELQSTFRRALELLSGRVGRAGIGDYLEFGVYNGTSMLCMYRALEEMDLKEVRLVGFDSFKGLPLDTESAWRTGEFATSFDFTYAVLSFSGIDWTRVDLVEGWFKDTLTTETVRQYGIDKAGVILIDCDLYEATREALEFCRPLIQDEAVIVLTTGVPAA
jgi:predicted O-methyltransferase YrrM